MDEMILKRIRTWAADHEEEMGRELSRWVQIPSVRDDESAGIGRPFGQNCAKMLEHVQQRAGEMGLDCTNHEGFCLSIQERSKAAREIGVLTHLDVVPATEGWSFPAFCGKYEDGFVYGRGAHDNKCAAVMSLYLLKAFQELKLPLTRSIRLIMGSCEETGMEDMAYYVPRYPIPDVSLVPDCTYPVNIAQKGGVTGEFSLNVDDDIIAFHAGTGKGVPGRASIVLRLDEDAVRNAVGDVEGIHILPTDMGTKIEADGVSTHSANPEYGKSAVWALTSVLRKSLRLQKHSQKAIETLDEIASDYYGNPVNIACSEPVAGATTAVLSSVRLAKGRITFCMNCRISLAMDSREAARLLESYCRAKGIEVLALRATPNVQFNEHDPRVACLQKAWSGLTGRNDPVYATGGNTYSRVFPNAITFGIIGGGYGKRPDWIAPGRGSAHQMDEFIHTSVMTNGLIVYGMAICELDACLNNIKG